MDKVNIQNSDIYNNLVKHIEKLSNTDISNFEVKVINNSSFFYSDESQEVYHYFYNKFQAKNIFFFVQEIIKKPLIYISFSKYRDIVIVTNHIPTFYRYIPYNNIIAWKNVKTLNSIKPGKIGNFIFSNLVKLLWEISRVITVLHDSDLIINKFTNMTIGFNINYFVILDFSYLKSSSNSDEKDNDYKGLHKLLYSFYIESNLPEDFCKVLNSYFEEDKVIQNILKFTQKFCDKENIFEYLNSLKINY